MSFPFIGMQALDSAADGTLRAAWAKNPACLTKTISTLPSDHTTASSTTQIATTLHDAVGGMDTFRPLRVVHGDIEDFLHPHRSDHAAPSLLDGLRFHTASLARLRELLEHHLAPLRLRE
jgi:hypothetical protein